MDYRKPNRAERRLMKKRGEEYTDPTSYFEDLDTRWSLEDHRDIEDEMIEMLDELTGDEYGYFKTIQEYRSKGFDTPPEEWGCEMSPEEITEIRSDTSLKFFPIGANPYEVRVSK